MTIELQHWNCEHCKQYNDILSNRCNACHADKPNHITYYYQALIEFKRGIFESHGELANHEQRIYDAERGIQMTEQEELFKKLYSEEVMFVKDMDVAQLREHYIELADIAFRAKCTATAAKDVLKDKSSKVSNKQFLVSTDHLQPDSELINAPKIRASRMSKIDKMRQDLSKYLDEATVNEMISKMEKKATETTIKSVSFAEVKKAPAANPFTITKEDIKEVTVEDLITETPARPHRPISVISEPTNETVKPMNPFATFGKK